MSNDEVPGKRSDDLERRMYSAETELALIHATMATKQDIAALGTRLAAIEAQLPHLATKAELKDEIDKLRTWMIGVAIGLFFSQAGMTLTVFFLLKEAIAQR
ncbi:hypothetical protein LJR289_002459 [Pseudoduganella sp. LjRoot289]|uniref:hypothetical protein n=1 Tax=Pseudoduganella sp. LjRoot289 TaxID=3342314 RepID=UPI003ECDFD70